jgi:predicted CopG family antitoxin
MVKVISLSNEAYEKLKELKKNMSFSEVVIEIVRDRKKKSIMEFAGALSNNANEWNEIKEGIYKDRKKFKLREYKF